MLLMSDYDGIQGVERYLLIALFVFLVVSAWIIGFIMYSKGRKNDSPIARGYFTGFGLFAFIFGLGRLILLYHDYFAPDDIAILIIRIGMAFSIAGLTVLCLVIELYIFTKTRKVISMIGSFCVIAIIFVPDSLVSTITFIGAIICLLLPFGIYVYIAKSTSGDVRKQAIMVILGMIFLALAQGLVALLYSNQLISQAASQFMATIFVFIALIFITLGFIKGPAKE